jgi:ferredoxin
VTESEVIISVPKLKTHGFLRFTGAIKNLFGTVPGTLKPGYHVKLQTVDRFADMLLDLAGYVRPALTIMDGVVGMDGDGPSGGRPFAVHTILTSPDPVALDVAALSLVGHEPASVPTISRAVARGWTTGQVKDLELLGQELRALRVHGFQLPVGGRSEMDLVPKFLLPTGTRLLVASPFVTERCVGCGLCIENCPVQTITAIRGRAYIHLSDCIRCYCCHEVCSEQAIELRQPWLGRRLAALGR